MDIRVPLLGIDVYFALFPSARCPMVSPLGLQGLTSLRSLRGGNKTGLGDLRSAVSAGSETPAEQFCYAVSAGSETRAEQNRVDFGDPDPHGRFCCGLQRSECEFFRALRPQFWALID
jgi:hypothetical protein